MAYWLKIGFKTLIGYFVFIHISKNDHCTSLITNATGCILVLGVRFFFFFFDHKVIVIFLQFLAFDSFLVSDKGILGFSIYFVGD
jgi:hypothetical protein